MNKTEIVGKPAGKRYRSTSKPVFSDPFADIIFDLLFPKGHPIFLLNGKRLQLLQSFDRDEENLSYCFSSFIYDTLLREKSNIPIVVPESPPTPEPRRRDLHSCNVTALYN
uniref:Uncharacterized protein n=1 Tax=Glossina pallidipes TaxID=7398 RepID=A0A1A9ZKZ2_GLOPL